LAAAICRKYLIAGDLTVKNFILKDLAAKGCERATIPSKQVRGNSGFHARQYGSQNGHNSGSVVAAIWA
jgi:hypothetical protein